MTDIEWRLDIDGTNWTCDALTSWTVDYGRRDAVSQPPPARGRWELMVNAGNRANQVGPGSVIRFSAIVDGGSVIPVATMLISKVTRQFSQPDSWNTIALDAEGPSVLLARTVLGQEWKWSGGAGASPYEERDGKRVLDALQLARWPLVSPPPLGGSPLQPTGGRTAAGHTLADRFPAAAAGWTQSGDYSLTSGAWTPVRFSASHAAWPPAPDAAAWYEVEWEFDTSAGVLLRLPDLTDRWYPAGHYQLSFQYRGGAMPTVWALARDPSQVIPWNNSDSLSKPQHEWTDINPPSMKWQDIGPAVTADLTLTAVDGWELGAGWDDGDDVLTMRYALREDQSAADHINEVTTAVRSVLWEQRNGMFSYQTRSSRKSAKSQYDVDACDVVTPTTSTSELSDVRNHVEQEYNYPGSNVVTGGREVYMVGDPPSQERWGRIERKNTGPILNLDTARSIADDVLAAHRYPMELLSPLKLKRLEDLTGPQVEDLLRLPMGSRMTVTNTPAGWVSTPTWTGFVEGVLLTGAENGTDVELRASPYRASVPRTAVVRAHSASAGPNATAKEITMLHLPTPPIPVSP